MLTRVSSQNIVAPEGQSATFIELFFDLVFVFSVTQVVSLFHHGVHTKEVVQAVLIFWLVWWAWTQFTWALNAADTTNPWVELGTLLATATAFFMAVAVPHAFEKTALLFGCTYVAVRGIGLVLYARVAAASSAHHQAVIAFSVLSVGGLASVVAGALIGGSAQYWLWGATIVLDIVAATVAGNAYRWFLHPEHFTERHGLFVIIALGESLIVAAAGLTGAEWSLHLIAVGALAAAGTCAMWWTYFTRAKPLLDDALEHKEDDARTHMARDAYSLLHFVLVCGVVAFAVAVEETVQHPADPLPMAARGALSLGILLFVGGMAGSVWVGTRRVLAPRIGLSVATAIAITALSGIPPAGSFAMFFVGVVLIALIEHRSPLLDIPVRA